MMFQRLIINKQKNDVSNTTCFVIVLFRFSLARLKYLPSGIKRLASGPTKVGTNRSFLIPHFRSFQLSEPRTKTILQPPPSLHSAQKTMSDKPLQNDRLLRAAKGRQR